MLKKTLRLLCTVVCCLLVFPLMTGFVSAKTPTLKVATWNILHGNDALAAQYRQLIYMGADVVALQEVDEKTERVGGKSSLEYLGKGRYYYRSFGKEIDYQGGEYGSGILSKCYIIGEKQSFREGGSFAKDGLMKVEIKKDGQRISIYNLHLSYRSDYERQRQIELAAEMFAADPNRYKVMMGDFNIKNFSELKPFENCKMINTKRRSYRTYRGDDWDTPCIDNIIYTESMSLKKAKMYNCSLSDHYPLTAEFELQ